MVIRFVPETAKRNLRFLSRLLFFFMAALTLVACQSADDADVSDTETVEESTSETEIVEDDAADDDEMSAGDSMADDDEMSGDDDMMDDEMSDDDDMMDDDEMSDDGSMMDDGEMDSGMMGLGRNNDSAVLVEESLMDLPGEPLAWVGYEFSSTGDSVTSILPDAPGFVYVAEGTHTLTVDGNETTLDTDEAAFTAADVEYDIEGEGLIWDIRLTHPDAEPSDGIEGGEEVFASDQLEGLPDESAQVHFVRVVLASGEETSVHTHPGPEFIYVTDGEIIYENELVDPKTMQPGDSHSMPAQTAVQKRNPDEDTAVFLSWFLLDPEMPFSTDTSFD